jgi:antitoxin (DNA-binding transcriptional repressor) of toxin-antitoxin stability system
LNEVRDGRESILVTKRGRPLARVVPVADPATVERVPGDSSDGARITGEIVETDQSTDWESL